MLDFVTWVEAGAPAFGWQPGRFLDVYLANRKQASVGVLEGSFVGRFVPALAVEGFDGTATECLARLAVIAGPEATRNRAWPATPRGLAGILRRLAPALREAGIVVDFGREGHEHRRVLRVHVVDTTAGLARVLPLDAGRQKL